MRADGLIIIQLQIFKCACFKILCVAKETSELRFFVRVFSENLDRQTNKQTNPTYRMCIVFIMMMVMLFS